MNNITLRTSAKPNMEYIFHYKDGDTITLIYEDKVALTAPAAAIMLQGLTKDKSGVMAPRDKNEAYFIPTADLLYVETRTFTPTQEQLDFYDLEDKLMNEDEGWYEAEKKLFKEPAQLQVIEKLILEEIGKDSDESETTNP